MRTRSFIFITGLLILMFLWLTKSTSKQVSATPFSPGTHKVIASRGVLNESQTGISLWHDYGAFALYAIDETTLSRIPLKIREQIQRVDYMDMIMIEAHPFNGRSQTPTFPIE